MSCYDANFGGDLNKIIDSSFETLVSICQTVVPDPTPQFSDILIANNVPKLTGKNKRRTSKTLCVVKKTKFQKIVSVKVNQRRDLCNKLKNTLNNDLNRINQCLNEIKIILDHKHSLSDIIIKRQKLLEDIRDCMKGIKTIITSVFCINHDTNGLNNKIEKKSSREKQLELKINSLETWINGLKKVFCNNMHEVTQSCIICQMPKIEYLKSAVVNIIK